MAHQQFERIRMQVGNPARMLLIQIANQRVHDCPYVFLVVAQRGEWDVEHVQTVVKILPQLVAFDGVLRRSIGGGNDSDIDRTLALAPEPPHA